MNVTRRLLPSGYRWVVLRPGDYYHILNIEDHWKPDPDVLGWSLFNFDMPLPPLTECGVSTKGGTYHISAMIADKAQCCPDCWGLAL